MKPTLYLYLLKQDIQIYCHNSFKNYYNSISKYKDGMLNITAYGIWRHVEENCGEDITKPRIEGTIYKAKVLFIIYIYIYIKLNRQLRNGQFSGVLDVILLKLSQLIFF